MNAFLNNQAGELFILYLQSKGSAVLTSNDVIELRQKSYTDAFEKNKFMGIDEKQLSSNPDLPLKIELLRNGRAMCPADAIPEGTTFTIDPKYVTLSTDTVFKWFSWADAPEDIRIATKSCLTFIPGKRLSDEIEDHLAKSGNSISIAALDLDNDGICGLAIELSGPLDCTSRGCQLQFYDNGGVKMYQLGQDFDSRPMKNAVRASTGRSIPIINNSFSKASTAEVARVEKLFTYDANKAKNAKPAIIIPANLTGGSNPEELGKLLLKALQTNNKNLWASCVHPLANVKYQVDVRQMAIDQFDRIRKYFVESGISQWNLVKFSRVKYESCDPCAPPGEKWLRSFVVEFGYKSNEFIGGLSISPVWTYKGKYFVSDESANYGLERSTGR
jgi:hypothetical protein